MTTGTEVYEPGDVIRDGDSHPAVVLRVDGEGRPTLVLPTSGDRALQQVMPAMLFDRITNKIEITYARRMAREEWAAGHRW